ncbi:rod shape-determining protein MreC [Sulfurimonas sp.]|uniref:rod shape-determining protein MreC n=1 Tax=Sulfurimonas sp. TaxID=2022749 RepID=UPI00263036A3|nr:rod shape-determining protein MreC [Sulfurimonas sp.]MCW8895369.1 rod shape-determining protein MreC [Sulfurimonas sp.]MCW9067512.1 rod shape-determining protein MreC [Sulfurimonas sp.]
MTKGLFSFLFIFIALLVSALYYTNIIQSPFISILNSIKINYHDSTEFIQKTIDKHFFQAKHIAELEEKLQKYENNHLVMQQLASEINDLFQENHSSIKTDPKVELVRTISYQKFADLNRIWLEVPDYNSSRVYGLTYKELVAGIVVSENGRALGLLNRDIKSSYAVYIGDSKAPGIAHGNSAKNLVVKFIPAWFSIKKGDEVTTSGLDEIFFKGLKVGTVISVTKSQGYQNAVIEPYYKANDPNYFHMIKKVK